MADFDELLASLEGEDEGKDDSEGKEQPENSTIKQMRAELERREKALRKQQKEIEELRTFRSDAETRERKRALAEAGLNEDQIEVFTKAYEEVTPETIQAFRTKVLGVQVATESEEEPTTGFTPQTTGGPPPVKVFTREEFDELYRTDPSAAARALREGRVQRPKVRVAGPEF